MLTIIFTTLGLLVSSAEAGVEANELAQLQELESDYVQIRDSFVADSSLSDEQLEELSSHADWRVRLSASSILGWRAHPQRYSEASELAPIKTRAGFARFPASDMLHDVAYMPAFAERLLHTETDAGIRGALAELIGRTKGDWSATVSAALVQETDPHAKVMMLATVRHGDRKLAEQALQGASTDLDSAVRQEVALQCSWLEGSAVAVELIGKLLDDGDAGVRGQLREAPGCSSWTNLDHG